MSQLNRPRLTVSHGDRRSPTLDYIAKALSESEREWTLSTYGTDHLSTEDARANAYEEMHLHAFPFDVDVIRTIMIERGDVLEDWAMQFDDEAYYRDDDHDEELIEPWQEEHNEMSSELAEEAAAAAIYRFDGSMIVVCAVDPVSGLRLHAIEQHRHSNAQFDHWPSPF